MLILEYVLEQIHILNNKKGVKKSTHAKRVTHFNMHVLSERHMRANILTNNIEVLKIVIVLRSFDTFTALYIILSTKKAIKL